MKDDELILPLRDHDPQDDVHQDPGNDGEQAEDSKEDTHEHGIPVQPLGEAAAHTAENPVPPGPTKGLLGRHVMRNGGSIA